MTLIAFNSPAGNGRYATKSSWVRRGPVHLGTARRRQGRILTGVINSHSRADRDITFIKSSIFFDPDPVAEKILAVQAAVDVHSDRKLTGTGRQILVLHLAPSGTHYIDAVDGFDRPDQYRVRMIAWTADDIELVVHSIDKKHVSVAREPVHDLIAGRPASAETVSRPILGPEIRLDLDDHSGNPRPIGRGDDKQLPQKLARHARRLGSEVKFPVQLHGFDDSKGSANNLCPVPGVRFRA